MVAFFFFYKVNTNNLLALIHTLKKRIKSAWLLLAGPWWEGPVQYWSVRLVKPLCVYYYWDVPWWRTTKAVLFYLKLHFNPRERFIVWGVRLFPGLEGSQVWLEPARHPSAARIRCIKNICGHSAPPSMSKERAGTGYCDWAQALHLEKSTKLWLQTQSAVLLFFLIMYTFMMHKNGQIVTLCSISPSQSPRFRLSKPQKLQNSSHCVHLDTYTISWRYTHQKSQLLSQVQLDFPCSNLHGAKTITYIRNFHWMTRRIFFFKKWP